MAAVNLEVAVYNFSKTRKKKVRALVDPGLGLSIIPRSLAEELEVTPIGRDEVEVAGITTTIERGVVVFEVKGREAICEVCISDAGDQVVIGAIALEQLGFEVDPETGELYDIAAPFF